MMANKEHLHKLLSDAIPVLCRNGLPPSVTFRVEAMIGITVMDGVGVDAGHDSGVTLLCFQQTVSDNGVVTSQFGSNNAAQSIPSDSSIPSHTPQKRPRTKHTPTATISVKQEYSVETSVPVKQEYLSETYPSHVGIDSQAADEYDTGEVEYIGDDEEYIGDEDYYDEDGQYYDAGAGYPAGVKLEGHDDGYMDAHTDHSYMHSDYMTQDYGQATSGRPPKVSRPRQTMPGAQPGPSRAKKTPNAARGGTRPRGGRAVQDHAAVMALAATGASGTSNRRGMLTNLARTIADQSEVASKFFCHICHACLGSKSSLVTHIKGSHLAASLYTCDECGASFKWYMQLHRHRRRQHGGENSEQQDTDYDPSLEQF